MVNLKSPVTAAGQRRTGLLRGVTGFAITVRAIRGDEHLYCSDLIVNHNYLSLASDKVYSYFAFSAKEM